MNLHTVFSVLHGMVIISELVQFLFTLREPPQPPRNDTEFGVVTAVQRTEILKS